MPVTTPAIRPAEFATPGSSRSRALWLTLLIAFCGHPLIAAESTTQVESLVRVGQEWELNDGSAALADRVLSRPVDLAGADPAHLRLVELRDDQAWVTPCQIEAGTPARLWWIVRADTAPRTARHYRLEAGSAPPCPELSVERTRGALIVRAGEHRILQYNVAHVAAPEGVDPKFGRNAHLHPVWTPRGAVVSDEFPPDHLHQSGVFLAYTKTEFEGRHPNFWELAGGTGRVRHQAVHRVESGPVYALFEVEHEHVDLSASPEGKVALRERWTVRVWNAGGPDAGYWLWDLQSRRQCASPSPFKLPTYHYGGMALRGARSWTGDQAKFLTAEGKTRLDGNHSRPRWCDLSGPVDGKIAGLAMLTHPTNFRFPEPLRIHPSMPYMVYTPSQLGEWRIGPGEVHQSSYRFVAHDQNLPAETLNALWQAFATQP